MAKAKESVQSNYAATRSLGKDRARNEKHTQTARAIALHSRYTNANWAASDMEIELYDRRAGVRGDNQIVRKKPRF